MGEQGQKDISGDAFEEGLRQILSYGPAGAGERDTPQPGAEGCEADTGRAPAPKPRRPLGISAERLERERKLSFWLNLLRPIAAAALLAMLAMFVLRVISFGN